MVRIYKTKEEKLLEKILGKQKLPKIEFLIDRDKYYGANAICFYLNGANIFLTLSDSEWNNLENFLVTTLKVENLPKGCQGYNGVDIPSGQIHYYSSEWHIDRINEMKAKHKWDKEQYKRNYADIKREANYVKKHILNEEITLSKNNIDIYLKRKKFIKFREAFLKKR